MDANWDIPQDIQLLVPLPHVPHDFHDQTRYLLHAQWHGLKSLQNVLLLSRVLHVCVPLLYAAILILALRVAKIY